MATRYWVGNTGSWNQTSHWSSTSGGGSGASVPTSSDDVIFDAASFSTTSTVTVPGNNFTSPFTMGRNITFADIDQTIVLSLTSVSNGMFRIYGDLTLSALMTTTGTAGPMIQFFGAGDHILTSNGVYVYPYLWQYHVGAGILKLGDALNCRSMRINYGGFNTNNQTLTTSGFLVDYTYNTTVIIFGSSTINIDQDNSSSQIWNSFVISQYSGPGSGNVELDPGTSTIRIKAGTVGSGKYGSTFTPSGNRFHNVVLFGDDSTDMYINYLSSSINGTYHSLSIENAPVNVTLRGCLERGIETVYFNANGSSGKLITLHGEGIGLPLSGTPYNEFNTGTGWVVGETFTLTGLDDVWEVTEVYTNEEEERYGEVVSVELVDPGTTPLEAGFNYAYSLDGDGQDLALDLVVDPLKERIRAEVASVSYVDVQNCEAKGDGVVFDNRVGGVDTGDNSNWLFATPGSMSQASVGITEDSSYRLSFQATLSDGFGEQKVVNGNFSNGSTGWQFSGGSSVSGGALHFDELADLLTASDSVFSVDPYQDLRIEFDYYLSASYFEVYFYNRESAEVMLTIPVYPGEGHVSVDLTVPGAEDYDNRPYWGFYLVSEYGTPMTAWITNISIREPLNPPEILRVYQGTQLVYETSPGRLLNRDFVYVSESVTLLII